MNLTGVLNIIIPVYNESRNISKTLNEIVDKVKTPNNVYIIYDDDTDNTIPVVKEIMRSKEGIHLLKNKYGRGFINAIKTGFDGVAGETILVVMADSSDDLNNVGEMLKLVNNGYDVVCGSRYMRGGRQIGGPRLKKILSRIAGTSLYYLIGIPTHDVTNSFKMYKKSFLRSITIESKVGFELGLELAVKAFIGGYKITEVPCTWRESPGKRSRFKLWKWIPNYLHWYWFAIKCGLCNQCRLWKGAKTPNY